MEQPKHYSKLPYAVAKGNNLKPYQLRIPEQELSRLSLLLDNCVSSDENWENTHEDGRFGVTRDWLVQAVKYWRNEYDW